MRIVLIADDITGANDSGVHLARCGWSTSVMFGLDEKLLKDREAIVFDTDSRSLPAAEAFRLVKETALFAHQTFPRLDIVFKKMDSTLRGNIGVEIDAVYEVFQPDFVIISPGHPANGRKVIDGFHFLNDRLLHETEIAQDPKTPVLESSVPELLRLQTKRAIAHVPHSLFEAGEQAFQEWLKTAYGHQMPYLVFDSRTDEDLKQTVAWVARSGYSVVWAGSAGLANALSEAFGRHAEKAEVNIKPTSRPVLLMVGSVSQVSRSQLAYTLKEADIAGIELDAVKVVESEASAKEEIERVFLEAQRQAKNGKHIAFYTTGERKNIEKVQGIGKAQGKSKSEISIEISSALAEAAELLLSAQPVQGLVLTGGDTVRQLFERMHVGEMELIDEIELGIPLGRIEITEKCEQGTKIKEMYVITKAGAFGKESSLLHGIRLLEGMKIR